MIILSPQRKVKILSSKNKSYGYISVNSVETDLFEIQSMHQNCQKNPNGWNYIKLGYKKHSVIANKLQNSLFGETTVKLDYNGIGYYKHSVIANKKVFGWFRTF